MEQGLLFEVATSSSEKSSHAGCKGYCNGPTVNALQTQGGMFTVIAEG